MIAAIPRDTESCDQFPLGAGHVSETQPKRWVFCFHAWELKAERLRTGTPREPASNGQAGNIPQFPVVKVKRARGLAPRA